MKVSLIISVYKNVESLQAVLDGLVFQTFKEFEIIISEDGESVEMKNFLSDYTPPNTLVHLTQPDTGWRKNQALNNAIRKSTGDYLIFIDGDCILHSKFIEHHVQFASPKRILAGKRVKLGTGYSKLFKNTISDLSALEQLAYQRPFAVKKDGAKFFEEMFYINPDGFFGFITRLRSMNQLKGCNMSFYKSAIEQINGFDEDYILPAIGEDIDLTWRFKGAGYTLFSLRNIAVQYHLHHKENWTDQTVNISLMEQKKKRSGYVCLNGLRKIQDTAS